MIFPLSFYFVFYSLTIFPFCINIQFKSTRNYHDDLMTIQSLKRQESNIFMIDYSKKLKFRGVYWYDLVQLILGKIKWIYQQYENIDDYKDLIMSDHAWKPDIPDHCVVFIRPNEFKGESYDNVIDAVSDQLQVSDVEKILSFIKNYLHSVKTEKKFKHEWNKISLLTGNLNEKNCKKAAHQALRFLSSQKMEGPVLIARPVHIQRVNTNSTFIESEFTKNVRGVLKTGNEYFEQFRVSNVVMLDDPVFIIPRMETERMDWPRINCEYVEVYDCDTDVELNTWNTLVTLPDKYPDDYAGDDDYKYNFVVQEDEGHLFVAMTFGLKLFYGVCDVIYSITNDKKFNQILKKNELESWCGREEVDKIKDHRELKRTNAVLKQENKKLKEEVEKLKRASKDSDSYSDSDQESEDIDLVN